MTAASLGSEVHAAPPWDTRIGRLLEELFPQSRFLSAGHGAVAATFLRGRLTTAFQPILDASCGKLAGRQAVLRVHDDAGASVAPWGLFAQAASDAGLVQLDRLARTLHALNHRQADPQGTPLFLHVEQRLLSAVRADHGAWFEQVLSAFGLSPSGVTIVLPPTALDDPVTFVRAAISYRIRGYRVAARIHSAESADISHVLLAEPHYAAIDAPSEQSQAPTARLVAALARRGIHTIARRVHDGVREASARRVGFDLLQGRHLSAKATA